MSDSPTPHPAQIRGDMMGAAAASRVVVSDPAHYAVALAYDEADGAAVVARGTGLIAIKIREIAAQHGIGVLQAPVLARALFHYAGAEGVIPQGLQAAVALALEWADDRQAGRPENPDTLARCVAAIPEQLDPLASDDL